MADKACRASVSLDSLPGPALQLVDQFVGRGGRGETPLLRTCRALRDTVLAGSKCVSLTLRNDKPADLLSRHGSSSSIAEESLCCSITRPNPGVAQGSSPSPR
jgi:hypothetical protein